jgi:hypothetical protein
VLRTDTEFLMYASHVQHCAGHGVDQGNVAVDQLCHVFITRGDDHRASSGGTAAGQGTDHIIGFDAFDAQQRIAQGTNAGMQRFDLYPQVVGHARPVGLVLGEHLIAERTALGVEHHGEQAVRVLLAQALEHVQHAFDRTGRHAL